MPQASDELRAEMDRRFKDPISARGPIKFLIANGWTLHEDWTWSKSGVTLGSMPRDEFDCMLFLIHEWDFGGVRKEKEV